MEESNYYKPTFALSISDSLRGLLSSAIESAGQSYSWGGHWSISTATAHVEFHRVPFQEKTHALIKTIHFLEKTPGWEPGIIFQTDEPAERIGDLAILLCKRLMDILTKHQMTIEDKDEFYFIVLWRHDHASGEAEAIQKPSGNLIEDLINGIQGTIIFDGKESAGPQIHTNQPQGMREENSDADKELITLEAALEQRNTFRFQRDDALHYMWHLNEGPKNRYGDSIVTDFLVTTSGWPGYDSFVDDGYFYPADLAKYAYPTYPIHGSEFNSKKLWEYVLPIYNSSKSSWSNGYGKWSAKTILKKIASFWRTIKSIRLRLVFDKP
ncbi:MAG: hypothetical protein PHN89_05035 [Candidatus Pacebacteria bacterium]|nr:hypothetical protein [Candidatus Paceibacterota bacterium]MDD5222711.1 hypothetical protein [bacterium]